MRLARLAPVQVWVVSSDEATMQCRDERHRFVARLIAGVRPPFSPVCVSWTASVDTLAVAASSGPSVGIDLERPVARRMRAPYLAALASSGLSAREATAFNRVGASERGNWLLRRWTAKEAHLKRIGMGLCMAPETIEIDWAESSVRGVARGPAQRADLPPASRVSHLYSITDPRAAFVCSLACEWPLGEGEVELGFVSGLGLLSPAC